VAQPTSGNAITSITIDFGDGTSGTLMGKCVHRPTCVYGARNVCRHSDCHG
jgi:hypothetical protein